MREFVEWIAFFKLRPWGEERADARAALMPFVFSNAFAGKASKPKFEDFLIMPNKQKPKRNSAEQMFAVLRAVATVQNAKTKKNGNG